MKADLIIKSRAIFDAVSEEPFAGFVAIKGNQILKTGKTSDLKDILDIDTKIYDFGNRTVMPGFHDSHTHLVLAGMYRSYPDLGTARSEDETVEILKQHYGKNSNEKWIYGFNWYHVYWDTKQLPTKSSLDKIFKDKPVFLLNAEAHGAWVNTRALEIAGITNDTPDPEGGIILRDDRGEATGFLFEAALGLVAKHAYKFTEKQEKMFLKNYMRLAAEYGITSLTDVRPYFNMELGSPENYRKLEAEGSLTVRIHTAGDLLGNIDAAKADSEKFKSDKLRTHFLKQFIDGVLITHTAFLSEDYADTPGFKGNPITNLSIIKERILAAHQKGLSIKLHAIGDAAITFCLDAFEEAKIKYGETGARHAIEHLEFVAEADIKRFGRLGVIPSMQPEHLGLIACWDKEEYRVVLGEDRASKTWPTKSLMQSAGVVAIGSDCPVVNNNPFYEIHRAVTRVHDDGLPEGGWNPKEKLTMAEVLKGYTYGSAYAVSRENELGTLQPGMLADIAVVDGNLFQMSNDEIRAAKVKATIMDGNIVFFSDGR